MPTASNGPGWSIVTSPNSGTESNHLNAVTCASPTECWAVGANSAGTGYAQTLIELWDGTMWNISPSQSYGGTVGNILNAVTCTSATDCWAVGYNDFVVSYFNQYEATLIEHWDGNSWTIVPSPSPYNSAGSDDLQGVACASASECWAVGTYGGRTLIERWDGGSWSLDTSLVTPVVGLPVNGNLSAVTCASPTECWAVGGGYSQNGTQTLIAEWNGTSWSIVTSPSNGTQSYLNGVACSSPSECWAVGTSINDGGARQTLIERWDGTSWSIVPSPNNGSYNILYGVACASSWECWAVGGNSGQATLIERWDGQSWSIVASPNAGTNDSLGGVACTSALECWASGGYYNAGAGAGQTLIEEFTSGSPGTSQLSIEMLRCDSNAYKNVNDTIDAPLIPVANATTLANQIPVSGGLVADGVTPLLLRIDLYGTAAPQGQYDITFDQPTGGDTVSYSIASHLQVLQNGAFSGASNNFTFDASSTVYAIISGINAEDILLSSGSTEVSVTMHVTSETDPSVNGAITFKIRKPPVVLVHGYSANPGSWTQDYQQVLGSSRDRGFIIPIGYGTGLLGHPSNTSASLDRLATDLDDVLWNQIESPDSTRHIFRDWAITRYDVVGHSQGGVLVRMLCTNDLADNPRFTSRAFRNVQNANRGRFRRIITIGSPHNGSLLLYYIVALRNKSPEFFYNTLIPYVLDDLIQAKFDPFDKQIRTINDANLTVDPNAKFHLIRTNIDGLVTPTSTFEQDFSCNVAYQLLGLCGFSSNGRLRITDVSPFGADSIVDSLSALAGSTYDITNPATGGVMGETYLAAPVAHADVGGSVRLFSVGPNQSQTSYVPLAQRVISLLDADASAFGPFQLPALLPFSQRTDINNVVPSENPHNDPILPIGPKTTGPKIRASSTTAGTSSISFTLSTPTTDPIAGDVQWFAEAFGPNGVTLDGIQVQVDPNDSKNVTLVVDDSVQGDVVLHASYTSTDGTLVGETPITALSHPVGNTVTGIELLPSDITVSVGETIGLQMWADYDNGMRSLLFNAPNQPAQLSSSDLSVAAVNSISDEVIGIGPGSATITAVYEGFTAQMTIDVQLPLSLTGVVSRMIHGSAGAFDVDLPLTGSPGIECRSGGANGDYTMVFTFSTPITNCGTAGTGTLSSGPAANQCSVQLSGVPNAQYITVGLTGVIDTNGSIGNFSRTMGVLVGDTTANGYVNSSDIAQTQSQSGQSVTLDNFREDVTVNGLINSSDIAFVQSQSGTALPTPPSSTSPATSPSAAPVDSSGRKTSPAKSKARTAVRNSARNR